MKRFLSVCFVLCLIFSLAVPVFAEAEPEQAMVSGKWVFAKSLALPEFVGVPDLGGRVLIQKLCRADGSTLDFYLLHTTDGVFFMMYNGSRIYSFESSSWFNNDHRYIDLGDSPQFVSKDFYDWFVSNASIQACDTASCLSSNANSDYICDDCGLPVPYSSRSYKYLETVTFRTESGEFIKVNYMSLSPINIRGYIDGDMYRVDSESPVWVTAYASSNNYDWVETYSGDLTTHYPSLNLGDEVISSTFDWYTSSSGDLFFPLPLWTTVSNQSQGKLQSLVPEVGGTMKILVLCGVGLIASLMVLSLFGKKSRIFLS